jgi:SAM-dependent methyltransferase
VLSFSRLNILNPKRDSEVQTGRASWYPYYAGFSEQFAQKLLASAELTADSLVSDPWNGSGTTTAAAAGMGHRAFGYDLNPVMVLAARARMLSKREKNSLVSLGDCILRRAKKIDRAEEPLATWFMPNSAACIRSVEKAIQHVLIQKDFRFEICSEQSVNRISDLTAFFYVALFRATRRLLKRFEATNPTWIKRPANPSARLRPSLEEIRTAFANQVSAMTLAIDGDSLVRDSEVQISVGSSSHLPLKNGTVDFVLSSPPYCTRIDYAVATHPELALLGYRIAEEFDHLRRQLTGTSTVPTKAPASSNRWGKSCLAFLDRLSLHPSKASKGYYLKNHLQYFDSIYSSLGEISRTLRRGGACVLVVQDSHYKEVHNNVPRIIAEMADQNSLRLKRSMPFQHHRTMAGVHPGVRKYRSKVDAIESVLCFSKG